MYLEKKKIVRPKLVFTTTEENNYSNKKNQLISQRGGSTSKSAALPSTPGNNKRYYIELIKQKEKEITKLRNEISKYKVSNFGRNSPTPTKIITSKIYKSRIEKSVPNLRSLDFNSINSNKTEDNHSKTENMFNNENKTYSNQFREELNKIKKRTEKLFMNLETDMKINQ
ncbi:MAG: hypothetical protein MJ252_01405 [archaeon]|nr:hypothetical protein [archaeon]